MNESSVRQFLPCRYSDTLQCAEVKRHVWTLIFGLAARLAFAAACVGDISMLHAGALLTSPLLPPLSVLLQWLATQQDIFRQVQLSLQAVSLFVRRAC